jgi:hypothetical protein
MKLGALVSVFFSIGAALAPGCGGAITFATPEMRASGPYLFVESEKS